MRHEREILHGHWKWHWTSYLHRTNATFWHTDREWQVLLYFLTSDKWHPILDTPLLTGQHPGLFCPLIIFTLSSKFDGFQHRVRKQQPAKWQPHFKSKWKRAWACPHVLSIYRKKSRKRRRDALVFERLLSCKLSLGSVGTGLPRHQKSLCSSLSLNHIQEVCRA